jgi:YD repeat-containing protein
MKINRLFFLLPSAALALSLNSCKPEEQPTPTPEPTPSNVIESIAISFDENGNPTDTTVSTNTFDAQGRASTTTTNDGSVVSYTYTATTATINSVNSTDPTESFQLVYTLDAQGRLSSAPIEFMGVKFGSITHSYYSTDKLKAIDVLTMLSPDTSRTLYTWTGDNNTLQNDGDISTTFDYDLTKRDLRNFGQEDLQRSRNKNILTKETVVVPAEPTIISTYEYEFDATGRPVKEIIKQGGLKVSETTYKY